MTPSSPIIFINRGNSAHLYLACAQARRTNPHRPIILLGDHSTAHYGRLLGVRHIDFSPFEKKSRRLKASFRNDSGNPLEFEFFCLKRWFILHEFLSSLGPDTRCIYLDSDILVYGDLGLPEADFAGCSMTFQDCSAHSSFINSVFVLGEFVDFILAHYEDPARHQALRNHTESIRRTAPSWNTSDMSFFLMFHEKYPEKMVNLHFPMNDSYALDQTIDSGRGDFERENGLKKITWRQGVPYCRHLPTGKLIRFHTLHFQGKSKKLMRDYRAPNDFAGRLKYGANQALVWRDRLQARMLPRSPEIIGL
jgi:hypothetical protein